MIKRFKYQKGFSLTEIMVVIALVGILAAVVLVSINSFRKSARGAKLASELNSAVAGMQSCWSFANGDVKSPSSGENICYLGSSLEQQNRASQYGKWPDLSQLGNDYNYGQWWDNPRGNSCSEINCKISFLPNNEPEKKLSAEEFFIKKAQAAVVARCCFASNFWFFTAKSASDEVKVCCNSTMKGCRVIGYDETCTNLTN